MKKINLKKEVNCTVEEGVLRITEALKPVGFGILTRIDFHQKMKEKLNKDVPTTVVLGACNPMLAYEAYQKNSDFTSLLPCNVVVRDIGNGKISVEIAKPTSMMEILGDTSLVGFAKSADMQLQDALDNM